ncbi:cysteine hydrolase family protein [Celerinatantimonas sp. YJH-8]|uniref:cysteine hydrolase family protein n=1 Tax=Celerinatantimonas sp. YJH-8 TaxID=3228714 RepID=UPI0038C1EBAB
MTYDQKLYQQSALLVIDVQQGLFDPAPADRDEIVENINTLIQASHATGVPVILIQHHTPNNAELGKGSQAWQLYDGLLAHETDFHVDKSTPDSFLRTSLNSLLASLEVTHLIVSGYSSEFCIDTTVRRAAGLGFYVTLAADAHTSHDKVHATGFQIRQHHNLTLSAMSSFGVPIQALDTDLICQRYLTVVRSPH